jgi:hypothetical protein
MIDVIKNTINETMTSVKIESPIRLTINLNIEDPSLAMAPR